MADLALALPRREPVVLRQRSGLDLWGRVVVEVRADDLMPLEVRYYDEDLDLARTLTYADVETRGGRRIPTRMRIVPTDAPEEYTQITWDRITFDVDLPPDTFSLRTLQR